MRRAKRWNYATRVAGTHYRQPAVKRCHQGQRVKLVRAPNNQHDGNAIEVWVGNQQIGFVPREEAVRLAWAMDKGDVVEAHIEKIWLPYFEDESTDITIRVKRTDAAIATCARP
ncbi:MAG: HIRAN domain-containing protein [Gammaproteobacteria bacterium]|nr:HIRAN domain-containing protein [Gammaproteobacteria bacterium]